MDLSPGLLGISRTFAYLPVFLTGFYFNAYKEKYLSNRDKLNEFLNSRWTIICFSAILIIMILIMAYLCPIKFIRYTSEYNLTNFIFVKEIIGRTILIISQIGVVLLANKIVTNKKSILTQIGINSMAIYILHLFIKDHVIKLITFNVTDPAIQLICSLTFTAIVVLILSRDFFTKYLNNFTDVFYNIFFKPVESKFTEK